MPTTYRLTTLKDVFDQVPADRIEACMAELARGFVYAKECQQFVGDGFDLCAPFEWTDDVQQSLTIDVQDGNQEKVISFSAGLTT